MIQVVSVELEDPGVDYGVLPGTDQVCVDQLPNALGAPEM